jgi:CDP-diacylglycerol--glycerol-3-phosphate 3-phosphatidyltransferase
MASGDHQLLIEAGYVTLYLAAVLTIWSMLVYLRAAWPELRGKA